MFNFLKSDVEIIRSESAQFLNENLKLSKSTSKAVSKSIDDNAAKYLLSITSGADIVIRQLRKAVAAKLAFMLHPDQESELIKAIGIDIDHVFGVEIPMLIAQGDLSPSILSHSAVLSGLVDGYVSEQNQS